MRLHAAVLGLFLLGLLSACVQQRIIPRDPLTRADLIITRSAEDVQLQWESDPKMLYTVMYLDTKKKGSPWQPLPHGIKLLGTGKTIQVLDQPPANTMRRYRLHIVPR